MALSEAFEVDVGRVSEKVIVADYIAERMVKGWRRRKMGDRERWGVLGRGCVLARLLI